MHTRDWRVLLAERDAKIAALRAQRAALAARKPSGIAARMRSLFRNSPT